MDAYSYSRRYHGVFENGGDQWAARITVANIERALGVFNTRELAARAYDKAVREYSLSRPLNFIQETDLDGATPSPAASPPLPSTALQAAPPPPPPPPPPAPSNTTTTSRKYIGICTHSSGFQARVTVGGVTYHIGTYSTAELAARGYDTYVRKHGYSKPLNYPQNGDVIVERPERGESATKTSTAKTAVTKTKAPSTKSVAAPSVPTTQDARTDVTIMDRNQTPPSSQYRGVSHASRKKIAITDKCWEARIKLGGTDRYLGSYTTEEEAAKSYDEAAREHRGARAILNFPTEQDLRMGRKSALEVGKKRMPVLPPARKKSRPAPSSSVSTWRGDDEEYFTDSDEAVNAILSEEDDNSDYYVRDV